VRRAVARGEEGEMPREQVLEIWQGFGRPAIPLRQGETCRDLEKFLSHPDIRDSDVEAIKAWVQEKETEVSNEKGHCKHGKFLLRDGCLQCMAERRQQGEPANAHRPYHLADGATIPSVTTILGVLDKPGLPHWAWECGKEGLDYREVRDAAARVGTIAHYLIADHLKGEAPDTVACATEEVAKANNCLAKYLQWEKEHSISPVMIETPLISEEFRFGGTPDLLAEYDGKFTLIDFKTGGGIYDSYFYQLAAYWKLLEEQGWPVASARILRISADDSDFEEVVKTNLDVGWQIFQHCLAIYRLQNELV